MRQLWQAVVSTSIDKILGAENDGHENDRPEIDGP